ncbi:hypothetical protein BGZ47_003830 [Haplosporangium gracile]|nr:hypothetical protein BGZ47_003830 [Haplosporangium gracile]
MTRDEKEMARPAASQAFEIGDQQHQKKQQSTHRAVDDNTTFADLHILEEDWGELHGKVVPGHQIAGTVAAAEPEALYKVGDRVGASLVLDACMECDECKAGQEQYCAMKTFMYNGTFKGGCPAPSYGGFANRIRLCSEFVYKLPNEIHLSHDPSQPPLSCPSVLCWSHHLHSLRKYGAGADKTVGVKGIGVLGHVAIQYAKAKGSKEIVVITDSDLNSEDVTKLGATRCIDFDESTKWEGVLSLVSNHGTLVILALSKVPIRIPTMQFCTIVSSFQGGRKDAKEMLAFTAKHEIHPWIIKVSFNKINDAIELQKKKTARFCFVLEADEPKEKGSNVESN